jgi:CheY-like chemotaxis protein
MQHTVLVVDDDQEVLLTLKEGLERYLGSFAVSIAGDGLIAIEKLRREPISLVVADLKMPRMDGFELLSYMKKNYPDVPVVAITGYSTPAMREMAQKSGAVEYLPKPFLMENLARLITKILSRQSDGGSLKSVSSGTFLQLVELEQKTCTVRMVDKASGRLGVLFFRNGELLDARCGGLNGLEAAYRIFSWDEVALHIQNDCPRETGVINSDLQPIILEAMRLRDEAQAEGGGDEGLPLLEEIDLIEIGETPPAGRAQFVKTNRIFP